MVNFLKNIIKSKNATINLHKFRKFSSSIAGGREKNNNNQFASTLHPIIHQQMLTNINEGVQDAFFIVNLGHIIKRHELWNNLLPRVKPYYAVKCNPDMQILNTLSQLGCGFDCASKLEIDMILSLGVKPSDIIFANPCKQQSHIEWSKMRDVNLMTFDSIEELTKIHYTYPKANCILRILVDDSCSQAQLGMKYGASINEIPYLFKYAKKIGINIVGLSFHVGSGCYKASAYSDAVYHAKKIFNMSKNYGFDLKLLDIGGGYPGIEDETNNMTLSSSKNIQSDSNSNSSKKIELVKFTDIANALSKSLDDAFPESSGVKLISEPGRYYVASSHTLATNIIGRKTKNPFTTNQNYMYYINDGLYGSFNCILYDHAKINPLQLKYANNTSKDYENKRRVYQSSIWGPTCDGFDCIMKNAKLPLMNVGEWLYFNNMGAYTSAAGSRFNGFSLPEKTYVNTEEYDNLIANNHEELINSIRQEKLSSGAVANITEVNRAFNLIRRS